MGKRGKRDQVNFIYFIKARSRIKIGVTRDLEQRLVDIGTHLITKPKLLGSISSARAYAVEKHIHSVLKEYWLKNEWFQDCPAVREAMDKVLAGDELGYESITSQKTKYVPPPRTHADWLRSVQHVSGLMWPDHPAAGFAKAAEISVSDAEDYLSGAREMPRAINCVLAIELQSWIYADIMARRGTK